MTIREMRKEDEERVITMMRAFYASSAVLTNGSEDIFRSDVSNCLGDCPYLEGYVFCEGGETLGYAMAAKSFSTEFGKPCIWVEDLYVDPRRRSGGVGGAFLKYLEEKYPHCVMRLEVEAENERAIRLYGRCGFTPLRYTEMVKNAETNP